MKLRQIAVAAHNLLASRNAFMSLVDAPADFTDPGLASSDLRTLLSHLVILFLRSSRPRSLTRRQGEC